MAFSLIDRIRQGDEEAVIAILQNTKYGNVDIQNSRRDGTALFWACVKGYLEIVRLLLEKGADINARNAWESTPLHAASDANQPNIARYLIQHGADIDARSSRGDTPCHLAAYRGYQQVVQILVENGANITILNNNRRNCLHEALHSGNENLIIYIEAVCNGKTVKKTISTDKSVFMDISRDNDLYKRQNSFHSLSNSHSSDVPHSNGFHKRYSYPTESSSSALYSSTDSVYSSSVYESSMTSSSSSEHSSGSSSTDLDSSSLRTHPSRYCGKVYNTGVSYTRRSDDESPNYGMSYCRQGSMPTESTDVDFTVDCESLNNLSIETNRSSSTRLSYWNIFN